MLTSTERKSKHKKDESYTKERRVLEREREKERERENEQSIEKRQSDRNTDIKGDRQTGSKKEWKKETKKDRQKRKERSMYRNDIRPMVITNNLFLCFRIKVNYYSSSSTWPSVTGLCIGQIWVWGRPLS